MASILSRPQCVKACRSNHIVHKTTGVFQLEQQGIHNQDRGSLRWTLFTWFQLIVIQNVLFEHTDKRISP